MKLVDFIIGIGIFGLVSIIIFGMINPDNVDGIYGEKYLNITVDSNTTQSIQTLGAVGAYANKDFNSTSSDIESFTTGAGEAEEATEASLLIQGKNLLFAIPRFFGTVPHVLGEIGSIVGIPDIFINWAALAIVVIIVLMIATAFLRNRLQT